MQLNSPAAASVPWGKRDSGTGYWNVKLFQICFNDKEFIKYLLYRELKTVVFVRKVSDGAVWGTVNCCKPGADSGAVGWQEKDKFNTL